MQKPYLLKTEKTSWGVNLFRKALCKPGNTQAGSECRRTERKLKMGKYFGTDGFRGEANKTLTVEHAFLVGRFLGHSFSQNGRPRFVIGKDTRRSSYMLEYALVAGLTASGADAYLMHVTTTPSVSYVVRTEGFDGGIMISASHNPYYDNGIKLLNGKGEKLEEEVIEKIEAYLDGRGEAISLATGREIGRAMDFLAARNRYIGYLLSIPSSSFKGMRVGLDLANGSASSIAKHVFDALGAKTFVIHNSPDGFNINANCGSTHIEDLKALVKGEELDVGFAYDGDADRCLCVSEKGELVDGDGILFLLRNYLKNHNMLDHDTVVTTVMSNLGLYKAFDEAGIRYVKTTVGDKYVYEEMQKKGYKLGGEQSGHIIVSKYASTGDGILTSLLVMQIILESKGTLGQLVEQVSIYPQILENVKVLHKEEAMKNEKVLQAVRAVEESLKENGRVLVRASGTEALVRIMVEGKTEEICRQHIRRIRETMEGEGLLD